MAFSKRKELKEPKIRQPSNKENIRKAGASKLDGKNVRAITNGKIITSTMNQILELLNQVPKYIPLTPTKIENSQ